MCPASSSQVQTLSPTCNIISLWSVSRMEKKETARGKRKKKLPSSFNWLCISSRYPNGLGNVWWVKAEITQDGLEGTSCSLFILITVFALKPNFEVYIHHCDWFNTTPLFRATLKKKKRLSSMRSTIDGSHFISKRDEQMMTEEIKWWEEKINCVALILL